MANSQPSIRVLMKVSGNQDTVEGSAYAVVTLLKGDVQEWLKRLGMAQEIQSHQNTFAYLSYCERQCQWLQYNDELDALLGANDEAALLEAALLHDEEVKGEDADTEAEYVRFWHNGDIDFTAYSGEGDCPQYCATLPLRLLTAAVQELGVTT